MWGLILLYSSHLQAALDGAAKISDDNPLGDSVVKEETVKVEEKGELKHSISSISLEENADPSPVALQPHLLQQKAFAGIKINISNQQQQKTPLGNSSQTSGSAADSVEGGDPPATTIAAKTLRENSDAEQKLSAGGAPGPASESLSTERQEPVEDDPSEYDEEAIIQSSDAEIDYDLKPKLKGRKFVEMPPQLRDSETSSLCSVM